MPWSGHSAAPIARVHHDLEPVDLERRLQRDADAAAELGRPRQPGAGQQQRELVAAEARDQPGVAHRLLQARAELGQQPVAGVVAERVVELLEAVEVDHRDRERRVAVAPSSAVEPLVEQAAVREPGQLVGQRQLAASRAARVFSTNVSAIRTSTSDERGGGQQDGGVDRRGGSGRRRAGRRRRARAATGVTSVRQPSSATGRGGRSGLHAAAAISSGESEPEHRHPQRAAARRRARTRRSRRRR